MRRTRKGAYTFYARSYVFQTIILDGLNGPERTVGIPDSFIENTGRFTTRACSFTWAARGGYGEQRRKRVHDNGGTRFIRTLFGTPFRVYSCTLSFNITRIAVRKLICTYDGNVPNENIQHTRRFSPWLR